MIKIELEKAIENGESVWVNGIEHKLDKYYFVAEYNNEPVLYLMTCGYEEDDWDNYLVAKITEIFKTKAEAEHYLHYANITRTEQLPFLTWEEFKEGKELRFYNGKYRYKMNWSVDPEIIVIKRYLDFDIDEFIFNERLTEANFYKAYDECVRLFRGKE